MSLIEIKEASKRYGDKIIIDNFTKSFQRGSLTVLRGKNGSGKTTFLKICMERVKLDKGYIKTALRLKCRYMPDYVELPYQEKPMKFIEWMLSILKIELDLKFLSELEIDLTHTVDTLSKGNKQKILLYFALVGCPDLVFLDEPFTALDAKSIKCIEKRLVELIKQGACIIVSSHEKNLFKSINHEVINFDEFNAL